MRAIILILALALVACKKEDPKPAPVPAPTPITQASTTFNIKSQAYLKVISGSMEIRNYSGANEPNQDTSTTKTISTQTFTFQLVGQISTQYPATLTINSGYKSYAFVDSTGQPPRSVTLW
jgi:hypothetical protein